MEEWFWGGSEGVGSEAGGEASENEASLVGGEAVKVGVAVNATLSEVVMKVLESASVLGLGWAGVCFDGGSDSSIE